MPEIILPTGFTETEQALVLRYLENVAEPVVFLETLMWDEIDGETPLVAWRELESCLPQPVRIAHRGGELVVSDYGAWKKDAGLPSPRGDTR